MFESKKKFSLSDYQIIVENFSSRGFTFVRVEDAFQKAAKSTYGKLERVTVIHHDIDHDLDTAVEIGEIEANLGIHSTYYVLPGSPYWPKHEVIGKPELRKILALQSMGHEVGIHNDSISFSIEEGTDPVVHLRQKIAELRDGGLEVKGSSSHGSPAARAHNFRNYEIFLEMESFKQSQYDGPRISLEDVGLEYEAYELGYGQYWTDSGGTKRIVFDQFGRSKRSDLWAEVGILVHPIWWGKHVSPTRSW